MIRKYLTIVLIFILILATTVTSLSVITKQESLPPGNEKKNICIASIHDGFWFKTELLNQGDSTLKNIQLTIDVKQGRDVFIPKKTYTITSLDAGEKIQIRVLVLGLAIGIFHDYPLITFRVDCQETKTFWTILSASIVGIKTKIINEISFNEDSYEGYTLFGPEYSKNTYLINNKGIIVQKWKSNYIQGLANYLLPTGELLRLDLPGDNPTFRGGGIAGRVEKFNKDSTLLWEFEYSSSSYCSHHDIEPLPNGNILLIAWEYKTKEEALQAGRSPAILGNQLWPDHIIEVEPSGSSGGTIVWEWHVWDHLIQDYDPSKENYGVVQDHPERINLNYGSRQQDWNHINSIDYNEELDQILLSVHEFNEIWVIDHSTSTEEAAGHSGGNSGKGGDLLYRWGNPQTYRAGDANDQKFFGQHGASWVEPGCPGAGNILVFNNGQGRRYSSVEEIIPPLNSTGSYSYIPGFAYGPAEPTWVFSTNPPSDMFSSLLSNAQRLPNGNTLICSAQQGLFLEVTAEKTIVWKYKNILPSPFTNAVARIYRYPLDHPGSEAAMSKQHSTAEISKKVFDFYI